MIKSQKKSNSKVKDAGSNILVPTEGLATRNRNVKYQSSSFHCSEVISKDKVFKVRKGRDRVTGVDLVTNPIVLKGPISSFIECLRNKRAISQ